MDDLRTILFKAGIPTYITKVITPIPTGAMNEIPISKTIPKQIGLIFGVALYTDSTDPQNNPQITTANATVLYWNLKDGTTIFIDSLRLTDMIYNPAGFPNVNPARYLPVNIPGTFDISTSFFSNPTGIISAAPPIAPTVIQQTFWYVSTEGYIWLMQNKYVDDTYIDAYIKAKR